MDEKDLKILRELRSDSRQAAKEIAKKIGVPRTTVHYRIQRMKEEGVIEKFTVKPDYSRLGKAITAFVLISFLPTTGRRQREVAHNISRLEGIYETHLISGEWDIILKVRGSSMKEIGDLVIAQLREMPGVGKTQTCVCFSTIKEDP